jgi:DNA-binding CsgD family transcriptional regulator
MHNYIVNKSTIRTEMSFRDAAEMINSANTIDDVRDYVEMMRNALGIKHVAYHTVSHSIKQIGAFTYSMDWARQYIREEYWNIDPVIRELKTGYAPVDWKVLDWSSKSARKFLREAISHGLGSQGWTVPIWGPCGDLAVFAVNDCAEDGEWHEFLRYNGSFIMLISNLVHLKVMSIIRSSKINLLKELSPREKEALSELSSGYSRAAVAGKLQITENTLRAYIDSARIKLGAENVTHAVSLAIASGSIVRNGSMPVY